MVMLSIIPLGNRRREEKVIYSYSFINEGADKIGFEPTVRINVH